MAKSPNHGPNYIIDYIFDNGLIGLHYIGKNKYLEDLVLTSVVNDDTSQASVVNDDTLQFEFSWWKNKDEMGLLPRFGSWAENFNKFLLLQSAL